MSDPARLFQSLNLEDMPVTRSQSQTPQSRGGRASQGRSRGRGRAQPSLPPVGPTIAHSGIQYDTTVLSPTSSQRAVEGLQSDFLVDRVQSYGSGSDRYYAFQLSKPEAVRIHDPAGGAGRIFECTCEQFKNTQAPCSHIWWLFAGLHAVLKQETETAAERPAQIELTAQFGELFPFIAERQASLPRELNRIGGDDADDPDLDLDELLVPEIGSAGAQSIRKDVLCDILASFYDRMIPNEVDREFVDKVSHVSPNEILVEGNLPATIYRLAMRDDTFFRRLQQVVPSDVRAKQYYETLYLRAQEAMQRLSQYAKNGPSTERQPGSPSDLTVPECARVLRFLIHQMCEDRDARTAVAPLGTVVASRLAVILVRLIAHAITFNRDIYEDAQWARTEPANEHPRDRNLFAYLIGNPPYNPRFPSWMADHFVIDRLRGFHTNEWKHLFELLTTIKDGIEEMDTSALPMAPKYAAQIDEMLRDYAATADEPSSSSSQMPRPG